MIGVPVPRVTMQLDRFCRSGLLLFSPFLPSSPLNQRLCWLNSECV